MNPNTTLTFVDFQNDFVAPKGKLTFDNGKGDVKLIKKIEDFFKKLPNSFFANAIVTYDTHHLDTYHLTNEAKHFPPHCIEGTKGWNLAISQQLIESKAKNIQLLKKSTYDMWAATIDKVNMNIIKNTQEVVLFGVASDICNKAALLGWLAHNVKIIIIDDLTRGIFKQTAQVLKEEPFATEVSKRKIKLISSQAFLNQLKERSKT